MVGLPESDVARAAQLSATQSGSTPRTDDALQALLASIVESSDDAIVSKSLDGIVMTWNRAAERIFGYSAAEMIGRSILTLAVPGHAEDINRVLDRVRRGERVEHYETIRQTRDGRIIHVSLTVSPIRDRTGKVIGASKIARDITDRKQTEEQNAALLDEVRQSVSRKDDFLAMLAHELRNPLAPLRNSIHLLRLRGDDPTVVTRMREIMERQVTHLGRLIDDLLDVSRITRGKVTLHRDRVDLAQLARHAIEDQSPTLSNSGIELHTRLSEIPVWVHADPIRLTQVLDNLLENARKFTEHGGTIEIEVTAAPAEGRAILRVRDTGIGIDPELLPIIFDLFTQADRSLDRSLGGLGLGLTLVKRLVELHGGKVSAPKCRPGPGC